MCVFIQTKAVKVSLGTAGERCHICVCMQIQRAGPADAPSARGTSPDVAPAHRQSALQET